MQLTLNQLTALTGIEMLDDPDFPTDILQGNSSNGKSESSLDDSSLVVNEIKGDLFSSADNVSLCHCISRDVRMGKGIAVEFKNRFGGVDDLKRQDCAIGQTAVLQRGKRYVYYLITKENYFNKPRSKQSVSTLAMKPVKKW